VPRFMPLILGAALLAGPALAQTQGANAPAAGLSPAPSNPNLAVASVRMTDGRRASKIIGAGVYSDPNTQIASIDDLMLDKSNRAVFAILSVGGLAGIGGKLVAVPFDKLQAGDNGRFLLPGESKDSLTAQPTFIY
jgi:hypothetical protein